MVVNPAFWKYFFLLLPTRKFFGPVLTDPSFYWWFVGTYLCELSPRAFEPGSENRPNRRLWG
jgi:hypothetical protein